MILHYRVLVGFSPRMTVNDILTGKMRYLNWQYTWWNGIYTIMLTKAAIMHRDYLAEYDRYVPIEMLNHVDKMRNCEDISMAQVVAKLVSFIVYITLSVVKYMLFKDIFYYFIVECSSCMGKCSSI